MTNFTNTDGTMNRQAVYDKVAAHLLTQNMRSVNAAGTCLYRTESGLKCAIGCLISDELYSKELEEKSPHHEKVSPVLAKAIGIDSGLSSNDEDFLNLLQEIHDGPKSRKASSETIVAGWPAALREFAVKHELRPYDGAHL